MILHDFHCEACGATSEALVRSDESEIDCPECGAPSARRLMCAPAVFQQIVPTTKTSKKRKAGYVHSHGDRPKTPGKIQVSVP